MKKYLAFSKAPALLKPHHPIQNTPWQSLTSLLGCNQCILQPPADWATGHLLGESFPYAEIQTVYSAPPADWAILSTCERYKRMLNITVCKKRKLGKVCIQSLLYYHLRVYSGMGIAFYPLSVNRSSRKKMIFFGKPEKCYSVIGSSQKCERSYTSLHHDK